MAAEEKFPFAVADSTIDCLILVPCMVTENERVYEKVERRIADTSKALQ